MNKYHFKIKILFEKDYPLKELENLLQLKAYKLTQLSESKGTHKTAKFIYKTKEFTEVYTDDLFAQFVKAVYPKLISIKQILEDYKARLWICIVFTHWSEKPCISLNNETIKMLADMNANYDVE